jgi:membrane fusion protein (multidrug efflux system)
VFPNPQTLLRPGQFARVHLVEVQHDALLVPQQAVIELQGAFQVAVVGTDNTAHIRPVKVGERVGSQWIITDGLKPRERVVVEGTMKVHDGTTVNPKPFHPDAHGAAATAAP